MELTTRKILIKAKRGLQDALSILPEAAVKLDAIRFFAIFTAVFKNLNTLEDKDSLMQLIEQRVKEKGDFTTSGTVETSRAFLISVAYITEAETGDKELLDRCKKSFPKTFNKFTVEYNKIVESWDKRRTNS
jgi:hypothetical protein